MKKLILVSMLAALLLAVSAVAQVVDIKQPEAEAWFYGGLRVDPEPTRTIKFTGGTAVPIVGNLWLIPQFDIGGYDSLTRTSSLAGDIAWRAYNHRFGSLFAILSPGVDWVNTPVGEATAYFNGAVGGFVSVKVGEALASAFGWDSPSWTFVREKVAVYVGYRYKSLLKDAGFYPEGSQVGFGIAIRK